MYPSFPTRFRLVYFSNAALTQDWTAGHKRACKLIVAALSNPNAASSSPYGMLIRADGTSIPVSHSALFFSDASYYDPSHPETIYRELIGAFHILIDDSLSCIPGDCVSICQKVYGGAFVDADSESARHQEGFATWAEQARKSGVMPEWWADSHQEGLRVFAAEDADWGLIDRVGSMQGAVTATERSRTRILSREQVQQRLDANQASSQRIMALVMMLERVATFEGGNPFGEHAMSTGPS